MIKRIIFVLGLALTLAGGSYAFSEIAQASEVAPFCLEGPLAFRTSQLTGFYQFSNSLAPRRDLASCTHVGDAGIPLQNGRRSVRQAGEVGWVRNTHLTQVTCG